ncbi:MAG: ATP-dependent Clp protease ATP-binding subunit [Anaerolineae bacterium]|nr:ATP-dependent Clp protease ATP-binding subunit [Anaerolineae bacterium]
MPSLNPNLLSADLTAIMGDAVELMNKFRKPNIFPELVLLAMLKRKGHAAYRVFEYFNETRGTDLGRLERQVQLAVETRKDPNGDLELLTEKGRGVMLSRQMIIALDEGLSVAQSVDEVYIECDHLLAAMTERQLGTAMLLEQYGITKGAMVELMGMRHDTTQVATMKRPRFEEPLRPSNTTQDFVADAKAGNLRAVYFREPLLRDLMNMVTQARQRHVILVGPDGVGKRTLGYSFALLMAEGKGPNGLNKLVQVKEEALLDNSVESIQIAIRQAVGGILFVPHVHRFFGAPVKTPFPKAGANLQKVFLGLDPVVIGTTTQAEWDQNLSKVNVITENSQILRVPEPNLEETLEILSVIRPHLAADYGIEVKEEALKAAATLAKRYIGESPLPRSAEHLLHRAAALVNMSKQKDIPYKVRSEGGDDTLDAEDVTLAAAQMTGIPVSKLGQDERTKYASMVEHIKKRIIGQEKAVMAVSRAVKIARVGLRDPKRPIGSFLFLGPSGVGKTELAKALAEFLFDDEDAMLQLDMSEYMDENTVSRLIGAPPGYVGYEGGGQLTDRVREQPYIVVLFDEIEKAHQRVLDVLLQVMEEGRLTDSQGNVANFSEAVVIMTSNLGAEYLNERFIDEQTEAHVMEEVKSHLRPEFINRLDDVIIFHPLSDDDLRQILGLLLAKESKLAANNGIELQFTDKAHEWMVEQNTEPQFGARPLRRIIQRYVREPLADYILKENPKKGQAVIVDAPRKNGTALAFKMK